MRQQRGFTMIELLITITIAVILLTIAAPSFQSFIAQNRVESASNQLLASFAYARSEAIKRGARITVCKSSDAANCGGAGWEEGWIIFLDSDNSGTRENTETLLRVFPAQPSGVTIRGNNNFVNRVSYLAGGASTSFGTFAVCNGSSLSGSRAITINKTGRPRMGRDIDSNDIPNKEDGNDIASCTNP